MTATTIVEALVDRINAHDLPGIAEAVTDDHEFVDSLDGRVSGREAVVAAWRQYFAFVPDYWIRVDATLHRGNTIALFGRAGGTVAGDGAPGERRWEIPAAWQATVRRGRVAVWRVYADNLPIRALLGAQRP